MSSRSSPSTATFEELKRRMVQSRLTYTDEWLVACYEWLKSSQGERSVDDFQQQVYEQWLEANLEEMESRCLPLNLKSERLKVLTGTFALQVNSTLDIGESAYSQYNKLKKLENENTNVQAKDSTEIPAWQPKPRGALYLTMTDGSQQVYGLEVESIPKLSIDMKPGCKILLLGPLECRRGVLHLKPKHVKPMGGEVEAFLSQNSLERTLCKILNKPVSTTAVQSQSQNPTYTNSQTQLLTPLPSTQSVSVYGTRSTNTQPQASFNSRTTQAIGSQYQQQLTQAQSQSQGTSAFNEEFEDDDLFLNIDETVLMAAAGPSVGTSQNRLQHSQDPWTSTESTTGSVKPKPSPWLPSLKRTTPLPANTNNKAQTTKQGPKPNSIPKPKQPKKSKNTKSNDVLSILKKQQPTSRTNSNSGFNSSDDDELFLLDENNLGRGSSNSNLRTNGTQSNLPEVITLDDDDDDIFRQIQCPQPTPKPVSNRCKIKVMPAAPYQYISQLKTGQIKLGHTIFVKVIITTITSNIQVDKTSGEWKLSVNINDGSGFLKARIASRVLDRIIGFTPSQMKQLKASNIASEREKINRGMQQLSKSLVHFAGIMKIQVGATENLILEMSDVTNDHIHDLVTRTSVLTTL